MLIGQVALVAKVDGLEGKVAAQNQKVMLVSEKNVRKSYVLLFLIN